MVRTDPRITDRQTDTHTHPQTTPRVSVETYRPRGETIGFKNADVKSAKTNTDCQKAFIQFLPRQIHHVPLHLL